MQKLTAFSWGYDGWGSSTKELLRAADKVEKSRRRRSPIFVDIRFHRNVRAPGFRNNEFEKELGRGRYLWMKELGNRSVRGQKRQRMQIADPKAAVNLLQEIRQAEQANRRIIFFCSCKYPHVPGNTCHRVEVGRLVLKAARKMGVKLEIAEWPGGLSRKLFRKEIEYKEFQKLKNGAKSLRLSNSERSLAGLPWGTVADFRCGQEETAAIVDPARCGKEGWYLPIFESKNTLDFETLKRRARADRRVTKLEPRQNF